MGRWGLCLSGAVSSARMARQKPPRLCKSTDCPVRFVPEFPRQVYHAAECRERERVRREDNRKIERALEVSRSGKSHKDHLPSAYLPAGTTRLAKVLADIRFEIEECEARDGTPHVLQARVRAVAAEAKAGERDPLYGVLILLAASAASWAIRLDAPIGRLRRPVRRLRSSA